MPSSSADTLITLVNVFTVDPGNQADLVAALQDGTEAFFSRMPGFISSRVLRGQSGCQVINYSQWRSVADIEGFRGDPNFAPYMQRIAALGKGESILCDVAFARNA